MAPNQQQQQQQHQGVDWQAQAVQAQQQVMQFSAAMARMQSQVQTYASFTTELQSQLATETQQLAQQQAVNNELQAQLAKTGGDSSPGGNSRDANVKQERDSAIQRCGQLVSEVGELRAEVHNLQEEHTKTKRALDNEQARRAVLEGRNVHALDLIELDRLQHELETSIATQLTTLKACAQRKS